MLPMGEWFGPEPVAAVVDGQRAIEAGIDVDASAGVAAAARAGRKLQQAPVERDGVVVADGALVLKAADAVEMRWGGLPSRLGIGGWLGEARVVAREKVIEDALGVGERAGLREPQFDDEAILEGAKETFDAALALGRGRGDPGDA